MQKRFTLLSSGYVCAALLCASGLAFAQSSPSSSPEMTPTTGYSTTSSSTSGNNLVLGSKIAGCKVQSLEGENLGTISDMIVNPDTGHIRYAVVNTGNKKVTVPWNALTAQAHAAHGQAPHFVLKSSKEKLTNAPKFNAHDLSSLSNRTSEEPIFAYYDIIWFPDMLTAEELNSRGSGQAGTANGNATSPAPSSSPYSGTSAYPTSTPQTGESPYGSPTPMPESSPSVSPYPSASPQ